MKEKAAYINYKEALDFLEKLKFDDEPKTTKEPGCIPAVPLTGRFSNEILQFFYEKDIMEV